MSSPIYIPDLDDADFRILIDARKLVLIKFWSPLTPRADLDVNFNEAAYRHPEVAFAQSNVEEHHGLKVRTGVSVSPTLQGWIEGNLFVVETEDFSSSSIDAIIAQMTRRLHSTDNLPIG